MDDFGTDQQRLAQIKKFRDQLNSIGPGFCLAKVKQSTIHLQNGKTHSCHHPVPHHIPLEEIAIDVSALHKTKYKRSQIASMFKKERPSECDYCWRVEDSDPNGEVFSDRVMKSIDIWSRTYFRSVLQNPLQDPSYLELSFSNVCNFKCSYCTPEASSAWMEEIKSQGPYPTSTRFNDISKYESENRIPYLERDENPYINAFWGWWPTLKQDLKVLRLTGGEPLLSKHTFKLLELIIENPLPDLELNINSNLCVPDALLDRFIALCTQIQTTNAVKSFKIYTSCEAYGKKAEYIRNGLDYDKWLANCHKVMKNIPRCKLTVMSTYNALSVTSFKQFLEDMLAFRLEYTNEVDRHPVGIDIPYLRWPAHQAIDILPDSYLPYLEEQLDFMKANQQQTYVAELCGRGFYDYEINRMSRVLSVFKSRQANTQSRKDFAAFVDEHDQRRGTNFLETFPEMKEFYDDCKR
jgi:organic radical activating enzyme